MIATMLKPMKELSPSQYNTVENGQEARKQIKLMTGQTALYDRLTPTEMVKYISDLHGMDARVFEKRKNELLAL